MREYVVENEFVKAVRNAGSVAYKLTSQTANGLPDRLVLFFPAKVAFVELKAPGKMLRPLQVKRKRQLNQLGFPVLCIDRFSQIAPAIQAILAWTPGEPFPAGIGAPIPELETVMLPAGQGALDDLGDYGDTLEPEDESELAGFSDLGPPPASTPLTTAPLAPSALTAVEAEAAEAVIPETKETEVTVETAETLSARGGDAG